MVEIIYLVLKELGLNKALKYFKQGAGSVQTIIKRMKFNRLPVPSDYYQGK